MKKDSFWYIDFPTIKKIKEDWLDRIIIGLIMGIIILLFTIFWGDFSYIGNSIMFLVGFLLGFIFKQVELP